VGRRGLGLRTSTALLPHLVGALALAALWAWLAPRPTLLVRDGQAVRLEEETLRVFGVDATFALLAMLIGVVVGTVVWSWAADRGWGTLVVLAVGGLAASWVAARLGSWLGGGSTPESLVTATDLTEVPARLQLRATSALVVWPLMAVTVALVNLWLADPSAPPPVSGGPTGPPEHR
jgi:hypothetical protein